MNILCFNFYILLASYRKNVLKIYFRSVLLQLGSTKREQLEKRKKLRTLYSENMMFSDKADNYILGFINKKTGETPRAGEMQGWVLLHLLVF